MYIVPSWGFLVQTALLALDDAFGRTRVGLIFLLPYQFVILKFLLMNIVMNFQIHQLKKTIITFITTNHHIDPDPSTYDV